MIQSVFSYGKHFLFTFFSSEKRKYLSHERKKYKNFSVFVSANSSREEALKSSIQWLEKAQGAMIDDGIGSYNLVSGWGSSYPETTGYIISTWLKYASKNKSPQLKSKALLAADWLIRIQKPSGGWQSMRIVDDRPEIVFNTGQALRGMIGAYRETKDQKYFDAAVKSGDWLTEIQHEAGYWDQYVFMGVARVYDSYVSAPLLELWELTKDEKYKTVAQKNIDWIINTQQKENGWFYNCDNTIKHNDRPILHTIAYTADGILDCGIILENEVYVKAAKKTADALLAVFKQNQQLYFNGRFDENWKGFEHMITTGCAQLSIIWLKLFKYTKEEQYLKAATQLNNLLIAIQKKHGAEHESTKGALFGSFPFWGRYEKFACPNWGTKYLADALMLELELAQ